MSRNWSQSEVEAAVDDYFSMLNDELSGRSYNKSAHRRILMNKLDERTDGSIELKHQNISAVLIEMGVPYIDGYKPRGNYQRKILPGVVSDYLSSHQGIQRLLAQDAERQIEIPSVREILTALEQAPKPERPHKISERPAIYNPVGVNYLEREASNSALGEAGEQFVINFERPSMEKAHRFS